ncbi:MAG: hypothetical protein V2J55_19350 [Candidatus Competibacteraceae bacterium]|jgi:hypothetical protein|nr:hypothetical protein [Candidatus Competibacteraceae bacterium]
MRDRAFAKAQLEELYHRHPELFPDDFGLGYAWYGFTAVSCKQQLRYRRLRLTATGVVFTVAPAFVMPYLSAMVTEVEKALLLMRFHVPCWVIAYVFGRDAMYWYRLQQGLGRLSVVGTTVKPPERLPKDLVADEKHTRLAGEKIYIATTAGGECLLGASVTGSASEAALTPAYGVFAEEATALDPDYAPETVNTDGWAATQGAWQALCPTTTLILCFLHAFLKIREHATQALSEVFAPVREKVWHAYYAPTKAAFAQRLRRLREWAERVLPDSPLKTHTLALCNKRAQFSLSYAHERAHRTSNLVDRLMRFLDRACFNSQYFHGTRASAESRVRSLALLWNFCPSSPGTVKKYHGQRCPAERLNGKRYAENWLENWLISGSMNGSRFHQQNPL